MHVFAWRWKGGVESGRGMDRWGNNEMVHPAVSVSICVECAGSPARIATPSPVISLNVKEQ